VFAPTVDDKILGLVVPPAPIVAPAGAATGSTSALAALTQFVPTEVVAVFIPGITAITAAFKSTGHMPFTWKIFGIDVTSNEQAFFAWSWFYVCLGLAVVYYLVGYVASWRRNSGGAWPRFRDVATPFVIWQIAATLVAAYLWGLSVAPTNSLLLPDNETGIDVRPVAAVLALVVGPLFASINQMITLKPT
jgi:hypothetical protein